MLDFLENFLVYIYPSLQSFGHLLVGLFFHLTKLCKSINTELTADEINLIYFILCDLEIAINV